MSAHARHHLQPVDVVVLAGPTGVGKTEVSLGLAEHLEAEIICCDSRQIFKYFRIGTAKPEPDEQARVRHHLLDWLEPWQRSNAADYMEAARAIIDSLNSHGQPALLVGGTGMYIKAVLHGLFSGPTVDQRVRDSLIDRLEQRGLEVLYQELQQCDPDYAARINISDRQRILRALEIFHQTGQPFSHFHHDHAFGEHPYVYDYFYLERERQDLYDRINRRVEQMLNLGWVAEVERLLEQGVSPTSEPMSSIGYREIMASLEGRMSFEEAITLIKRDTRRYAKRQLTWFRNTPGTIPIFVHPHDPPELIVETILSFMSSPISNESDSKKSSP